MTQSELLSVLKDLVVETSVKANPVQGDALTALQLKVNKDVQPEMALASLGWDSLQFTWLLVAAEERLNIDTSTLSLFDLFSVGDLLSELQGLIEKRGQVSG